MWKKALHVSFPPLLFKVGGWNENVIGRGSLGWSSSMRVVCACRRIGLYGSSAVWMVTDVGLSLRDDHLAMGSVAFANCHKDWRRRGRAPMLVALLHVTRCWSTISACVYIRHSL